MSAYESVFSQALELPMRERYRLVTSLMEADRSALALSDDDGVSEALRREAMAEADPSLWLTEEEFLAGIRNLPGR